MADKFTLYLRERDRYSSFNPVVTFSKSGSEELQIQSTSGSLGDGVAFAVFDRSYLDGKKIRIEWDGSSGFSEAYRCCVSDGEFRRDIDADWAEGSDGNFHHTKGNGELAIIDQVSGSSFDHDVTSATLDLSGGTEDKATLFVFLNDGHSAGSCTIHLQALQVLDAVTEAVLKEAELSGDVVMEKTGSYGDYGYVSSSATTTTASSTTSSTTTAPPGTGWLPGWARRLQITIDHTKIDSELTDFPLMVLLSASSGQSSADVTDVFDKLGSDANRKKIAVTTAEGTTQCYVEIERWDHSNEKAWLHVKVPTVKANVDTILYLYYDASQPDNTTYVGDTGDAAAQSVWDSDFMAVYHLDEDPTGGAGAIKDSTGNHNGTAYNMESGDLGSQKVGNGLTFGGTNEYIDCGAGPTISGDITVEAICKRGTMSGLEALLTKYDSNDDHGWLLYLSASGAALFDGRDGSGNYRSSGAGPECDDDAFHYLAGQREGSVWRIHEGESNVTQNDVGTSGTIHTSARNLNAARSAQLGFYYQGSLDECRISNIARNAAWRKATYNTLFDGLLILGTETETTNTTTTTTTGPGATTTTEDPCISGYGWAYNAPHEFNTNESQWAGRTLRYVIPGDKLRVSGSTVSVYFAHAGVNYDISKAYIGHQAASGHPYDFDGNQVQLTFDTGNAGATITSPGKWSDKVTFSLDAKKDVIVAVYFSSNGIPAGLADGGIDSWWKDGDDAATTDASGYTLRTVDLQRVIDLICANAGIGTTTTTTTTSSSTTCSTVTGTEPGSTTTSQTTTTSSTTVTQTTTTSGPYWAWYQDKPVLLVEPNWLEPQGDAIVDPYKVTGWYGTEYAYGHYGEGEVVLDLQFTRDGVQEIRGFYDFFDLNRGRLGGFWLPTWKSDLLVTEAFDASDTVLTVKNLKWQDYYKGKAAPQYLFFVFPDGTWAVRKMMSSTSSTVTLDSAIGKTVSEAALGLVLASFLFYGRFEQDVLEMEYASAEVASCMLTFHSLPTGTPGVITTTTTTTTSTTSSSTTTST